MMDRKLQTLLFILLYLIQYNNHYITASLEVPACLLKTRHEQCLDEGNLVVDEKQGIVSSVDGNEDETDKYSRVIAIGDVHGSFEGLVDNLYSANITLSTEGCAWKPQGVKGTLLVQMGDIVDRGPEAMQSWKCMRRLQREAHRVNSKVVRLFGNHELWWLEGIYRKRHPTADTRESVMSLRTMIKEDIVKGLVQGAFVYHMYGVPIMFVHAGFSNRFVDFINKRVKRLEGEKDLTADMVARYTNEVLLNTVASCKSLPCKLKQKSDYEVFDAGPDRGGTGIGGPFWTDFDTISRSPPTQFMQIVGHTMAYCYNPSRPGVHPPLRQAECSLGLIRASKDLKAVCVDGGMYLGARAFLEIGEDAHLRSFQRYATGPNDPSWQVKDLTAIACK